MSQPSPSGPMTWKEICEKYPDEWVALVEIDCANDRDFDFRSARVAGLVWASTVLRAIGDRTP